MYLSPFPVEVVDPLTGESLQTVWHPIGLSVQGITSMQDISGNGIPELVTLVTRKSDGLIGARLSDLESGKSFKRMWYRANSKVVSPVSFAIFDDVSGNGIPEVGVAVMRQTDGRQVVQLRDPDTGRLATNVWLAPGFMAQRIVVMPAVDGVQGVGVLGYTRKAKYQARIYNAETGQQRASAYYPMF